MFPEQLYFVSKLFYLYNCHCIEFSLCTDSKTTPTYHLSIILGVKCLGYEICYLQATCSFYTCFLGPCACFLELTTSHLLQRYQFPFAPPVHTPVSVHQVPDFYLKDSLTSEPAVSRLRLAWNLGWHENIENLSRVKGVEDTRQSDRDVG